MYQVTTYNGSMRLLFPCATLVDVIDAIEGTFGSRWSDQAMLNDLLSGLEHVCRVDDVWIVVTALQH